MYTISQLAKRFSLSRSTLIYYDKAGLLKPSGRSHANYRVYSDRDIEKLERIALFRSAGVPLSTIAEIIDQDLDQVEAALEARLISINREIQALRGQQKVIMDLIKHRDLVRHSRVVTKAKWVAMLRAAGLDEAGMRSWHREFEKTSPEGHQDFLESIGLADSEITAIRTWSRQSA